MINFMNKLRIKYWIAGIYPPHIWTHILLYTMSKNKNIIKQDVIQWVLNMKIKDIGFFQQLSYLLIFEKPFRNLFYKRLGLLGEFLNFIIPGERTLYLTPHEIGGVFL